MKNFIHLPVMWLILILFPVAIRAQVLIQGPQNPGKVTEQQAGCLACPGASWTSPVNILQADGLYSQVMLRDYAFCFMGSCYFSRGLLSSKFGFTIPASATISGIKAGVRRYASLNNAIRDTVVQLVYDTTVSGNAADSLYWATLPVLRDYGDSSALWGMNWTPARINDSSFGLLLKVMNRHMSPVSIFDTGFVDHIALTVYYKSSAGIAAQQTSTSAFSYLADRQALLLHSGGSFYGAWQLHLFDVSGKVMMERRIEALTSETLIPVPELPGGIYLIRLSRGNEHWVQRILIGP